MLEPLFTDIVRFRIVVSLFRKDGDFSSLKEEFSITDGNLNFHLKKLENSGIIETEKTFVGKKSKTFIFLTVEGRKKLFEHLYELEKIVKETR